MRGGPLVRSYKKIEIGLLRGVWGCFGPFKGVVRPFRGVLGLLRGAMGVLWVFYGCFMGVLWVF